MPKVRILTAVAGVEFSHVKGDVVELPGPTAGAWCEAGMAELVREPGAVVPERAGAAPETAAAKSRASRASSRSRKSG